MDTIKRPKGKIDLHKAVRLAALYRNMTMTDLARKTGCDPSNFKRKFESGSIRFKDVLEICDAIDAKFDFIIEFDDGMRINSVEPPVRKQGTSKN